MDKRHGSLAKPRRHPEAHASGLPVRGSRQGWNLWRCPLRRVAVEKDPRRTAHAIVPPHIFAHMATLSDARFPGLAERGRESLVFCTELRTERLSLRGVTPLAPTTGEGKRRTIYDAQHG